MEPEFPVVEEEKNPKEAKEDFSIGKNILKNYSLFMYTYSV